MVSKESVGEAPIFHQYLKGLKLDSSMEFKILDASSSEASRGATTTNLSIQKDALKSASCRLAAVSL